jgi:outer membrane protein assembly factor BamD
LVKQFLAKDMQKKLSVVAATVVLLGLSGCGLFSEKADETKGWSATKLYSEANEELEGQHYERAIQLFEKLESSYPSAPTPSRRR